MANEKLLKIELVEADLIKAAKQLENGAKWHLTTLTNYLDEISIDPEIVYPHSVLRSKMMKLGELREALNSIANLTAHKAHDADAALERKMRRS